MVTRLLFLVAMAVLVAPLHAQEGNILDQAEMAESVRSGKGAGDFIAAPIPIVDPTIGNGLGAVAAYLYALDETSKVSFTGIGGMYTDSESWAAGIATVPKRLVSSARPAANPAAAATTTVISAASTEVMRLREPPILTMVSISRLRMRRDSRKTRTAVAGRRSS